MLNAPPYEVIAAPFTLYIAAIGTAFPDVAALPHGDWRLVGSSGDLNYADTGVKVDHKQTVNYWRSLGDSGSRKAFRITEDLMISMELVDLTLEQYALALNGNAVSSPSAGSKKVGLSRGLTLDTRALLMRGPSPYLPDGVMQYEVPIAVQDGSSQVSLLRSNPAGLSLQWTALVDPNAASPDERFGRLVAESSET